MKPLAVFAAVAVVFCLFITASAQEEGERRRPPVDEELVERITQRVLERLESVFDEAGEPLDRTYELTFELEIEGAKQEMEMLTATEQFELAARKAGHAVAIGGRLREADEENPDRVLLTFNVELHNDEGDNGVESYGSAWIDLNRKRDIVKMAGVNLSVKITESR